MSVCGRINLSHDCRMLDEDSALAVTALMGQLRLNYKQMNVKLPDQPPNSGINEESVALVRGISRKTHQQKTTPSYVPYLLPKAQLCLEFNSSLPDVSHQCKWHTSRILIGALGFMFS